MPTKLSKPRSIYQIVTGIQDLPLLPLGITDIHVLLASIDPVGKEKSG